LRILKLPAQVVVVFLYLFTVVSDLFERDYNTTTFN